LRAQVEFRDDDFSGVAAEEIALGIQDAAERPQAD